MITFVVDNQVVTELYNHAVAMVNRNSSYVEPNNAEDVIQDCILYGIRKAQHLAAAEGTFGVGAFLYQFDRDIGGHIRGEYSRRYSKVISEAPPDAKAVKVGISATGADDDVEAGLAELSDAMESTPAEFVLEEEARMDRWELLLDLMEVAELEADEAWALYCSLFAERGVKTDVQACRDELDEFAQMGSLDAAHAKRRLFGQSRQVRDRITKRAWANLARAARELGIQFHR